MEIHCFNNRENTSQSCIGPYCIIFLYDTVQTTITWNTVDTEAEVVGFSIVSVFVANCVVLWGKNKCCCNNSDAVVSVKSA